MVSLLTGVELLRGMGFYAVVFPWIFVTAITYGILSTLKPLGDNTNINIIISAVIGFIFISFLPAVTFLHWMIPYLMIIFIMLLFAMLMFMFMGVDVRSIAEVAIGSTSVYGPIIAIILVGVFIFLSLSLPAMGPVSVQEGQLAPGSGIQEVAPGYEYESPTIAGGGGEGKLTTGVDDGSKLTESEGLWQDQTIFHPTMLGIYMMFIVFGIATYVVTAVKL